MDGLSGLSDPADRNEVLRAAQERVAERATNVFLFQLAMTGVADARIKGLWKNAPIQANDMTQVYWED
jgi:peptide/nickel transport system substrate-binding protein